MTDMTWLTKEMVFGVVFVSMFIYAGLCLKMHFELQRLHKENRTLRRRIKHLGSPKKNRVRSPVPQKKSVSPARPLRTNGRGSQLDFSAVLQGAEIGNRLQRPVRRKTPEKYRLFLSLASEGVNACEADEALKIMGISKAEARQLMKLTELSRRVHCEAHG